MVNAPVFAKERGLDVREVRHEREVDYHTLVAVTVGTSDGEKRVAGTLFGNRAARLVDIFGVAVEAELTPRMIYIVNTDAPGFIGALGTTLGKAGVNIATFNLGRREALAARRSRWSRSTIRSRRSSPRSSSNSRECARSCP